MAAEAPRTLKTAIGAGGQRRDIYDQAIDSARSTPDVARLIAGRAEAGATLRESLGLPVEALPPVAG